MSKFCALNCIFLIFISLGQLFFLLELHWNGNLKVIGAQLYSLVDGVNIVMKRDCSFDIVLIFF